jgi:hypothetical protein
MFQFPGLPSPGLCVQPRDTRALPRVGFPIRKSRDQRLVSTYPGLIAAAHVLLRLLAPRHPPCALILLIGEEHQIQRCHYGVFKVRTGRCPPYERKPPSGRSLKTQQRGYRRGRRSSRRARYPDGRSHQTGRAPTEARAPDSLERR